MIKNIANLEKFPLNTSYNLVSDLYKVNSLSNTKLLTFNKRLYSKRVPKK